jgi:hypothetical protein
MAGIIHMETDQVRSAASQLDHTSQEIQRLLFNLSGSILSLNWQSQSRDLFVQEFRDLERKITASAEEGMTIALGMRREVDEWEQAALHLGDGGASFSNPLLIIGGGGLIVIGGVIWWGTRTLEDLSSEEAEARIEDILRKTPAGRDAIQKAEELGINVEVNQPGKGTFYNPENNTMYIDPKTQPDLAAESYVHELQHAKQDAEGRLPNPRELSRDEFTERVIDVESEALIKEYEYEKERPFLDIINESTGEGAYENTYNQTIESLRKSNPQMSAEEMHKLAYEAGKEEVKKLYRDGTIKASTNRKSYVDNAHGIWDQVNAPQSSDQVM